MPDYRVQLDSFEGPLDLLLFLIRRAEVDITDIPIAAIADQYVAYLRGLEKIDIELAGEFLVMAATLMEIKSRLLSPAARSGSPDDTGPESGGGGEDPRAELVRQLLAYKQYRDAAESLESRKQDWERRFPAGRAGIDDERLKDALAQHEGTLDLDDLSLVDLVESFSKIVAAVNFDRLGDHTITYDDTPIELHAEDILDRLRTEAAAGPLRLATLFQGRTRGEAIGLFLATLELVRRRAIRLRQETPGGDITIGLREEPAEEGSAPAETPEAPRPDHFTSL
jgi:segregation and condensation protein A